MQLDPDLPPALVPLAWVIGRWQGAGVIGYPGTESANFGQELDVWHDGRPFLHHRSTTWVLDDAGEQVRPLGTETGYWRPGRDGELELLLANPDGFLELYAGTVEGPRITLQTDAVVRTPDAEEYTAASRLYGLVEGDLLWALDKAAGGHPLQSHMSAQLKRVS
ncbi:heme-binding beta-barrel domain-containing protein [Angustibacter aerolatus]